MTKQEFLGQLAHRLYMLPENERQDALDYYDGYISDAEDEVAAVASLGSPAEAAAVILASAPLQEHRGAPPKGGMKKAWFIILAFFALPIGLPILIGVGATAFALFISLAAIIFSLVVTAFALGVAGIIGLVASPVLLFNDMGFALMAAGMGFAGIGLCILIANGARRASGGFMRIARFVGNKITSRRSHHGRTV